MILRLIFIVLVTAAFARGFSAIVEQAEAPTAMHPNANPCDEWSDPNCGARRWQ
jgi:hypothetical protein